MPTLSLSSGRSLANTLGSRVFDIILFSGANISASATIDQLGGSTYRSTAVSSTWSFNGGNVSFTGTGLPYHSYSNTLSPNTPVAQNYNLTWTYRGGQNSSGTQPLTAGGLIGLWLNGVAVFNPSAQNGGPSGPNPLAPTWQYNAAYESGEDLNYTFGEDFAGGHAPPTGTYHYHDGSFFSAWETGIGHTSGTIGATGLAECAVIPYLRSGLRHPDGHSKILAIAADGYPVYGPFGYDSPLDSASGIRRMTSGYSLKSTSTRSGGASNTSTYPMGIFVQDYSYIGSETEVLSFSVVNDGSSSYVMTRTWETRGVAGSQSLGANPTLTIPAGSTVVFDVTATGHNFWLKTSPSTGTGNAVTAGTVTNNGTASGKVYWHTGGVSPGTYYYTCEDHSSMQGVITITSANPSTLDTYNGRYCVTPDYPAGTYAYFMTFDKDGGAIYPYFIGNRYYGTPATLQ